jgi:hypothetical protein
MAAYVELFIDQGTTFNSTINVTDDINNQYINVGAYIVTSQLRRSYYSANASASFTCSVSDSANGEITLSMAAPTTANLKAGRYYFDVTANVGEGIINRLLEGIVTVSAGVTR